MVNFNISPSMLFSDTYDEGNQRVANSNIIVVVVLSVIIVIFYIIFYSLGKGGGGNNSSDKGLNILEMVMWGSLIFLVLINGLQYFFGIDIKTSIRNIFSRTPQIDVAISPHSDEGEKIEEEEAEEEEEEEEEEEAESPEIMIEKQVFHVPINKYTYEDARALCGAFGGRLANYSEIEEAYNKGGEWCSYGWSQDQNIYFPTQQKTYNILKKIKGHEHDCGRPGVNGGYIDNPNARFGVNCLAPKPEMDKKRQQYMESLNTYPITQEEKDLDQKVAKYKQNIKNILVSPFNNQQWSKV